MDALWKDLRHACRTLIRQRIFALPAVLSLALGMGVNVAIFSFIYAAFVQPLPVLDPPRLVSISAIDGQNDGQVARVSYLNYSDYRDSAKTLSALAAYRPASVSLEAGEGIQMIFGEIVSANYFDVIGVRAAHGRTFLPEEGETPGAHPVVVLSHGLWQRSFGADPGVVGRTLKLAGQGFTVIGIAPEGFAGLDLLSSPELWLPIMMREQVLDPRLLSFFELRNAQILSLVGRLRDGVGIARARAEIETLTRNLVAAYPAELEGLGVTVRPLVETALPIENRSRFVLAGWLLMGVVALLLLIACANVTNLLLARSLARRREIAVRLAIGAGRRHLFRQLAIEGLVLAAAGGAAALLLAVQVRNLLWSMRPAYVPDTLELDLNPAVLGFALGLIVLTGVLVALAPIHQSLRLDLVSELKDRSGPRQRLRGWLSPGNLLVTGQIALSVIVLVGAGLFLDSLRHLQRIDAGVATDGLFLLPVPRAYGPEQGQDFYPALLERVEALPAVRAVAMSSRPLLAPGGFQDSLVVEGQEGRDGVRGVPVPFCQVHPGYFRALGIPLVRGRTFTPADRGGVTRVAVVNEAMAAWLWPAGDALGKRFRLETEEELYEVAGVVADVKNGGLEEAPRPYIYFSALQSPSRVMILHVRAAGEPGPVIAAVRREIHALDPQIPLLGERRISDLIDNALWAPRMIAGLLSVFGLLALALSTIGIYGVVSYATRRRRREFGIRGAMGAGRRQLLGMVLQQGLAMAAAGVAVGCAACVALVPKVADLLAEDRSPDLVAYAGAALVVTLIALVAVSLPARRASAVDPVVVLREE